jgi:hypothetical protein
MATYKRNLEIVSKKGTKIKHVNLGVAVPTASGIIDFDSTPDIESFRIRNVTIPLFLSISGCSALNVFDIADNFISLQCGISCLSAFADKKAFYPSVTGYVYLTGVGMPEYIEKPRFQTPEFFYNTLYNYLVSGTNKWQVFTNYAPVYRYIDNNWDTFNIVTTGNKSAYLIVPNNIIKNFIVNINGKTSLSASIFYSFGQPLSANYLALTASQDTEVVSPFVLYSNSVQITADGQINTIQYISNLNGPLIGVAPGERILPFIETFPFEATLPEPTYPSPFNL